MTSGIIYYIASRFWGGGEEYVLRLSLAMRERGHSVAFVLQPDSAPILKERFAEVGDTIELEVNTKNGKFSFASAHRLLHFAYTHRANVIHVNAMKDYFVAVWAKLLGIGSIRVVATNHLVERAKSKLSWRLAYSHIDALINVSECAKAEFLSSPKLQNVFKRVYVVKNTVPSRPSRLHDNAVKHIPIKVLYHGRIHKEKGILDLVSHWHKVQNAVLYIAGSGEPVPDIPNVVHLGFHTDVRDLLAECDISVSPSIARESGGPLSLIEAMAAGKPVVASDNGSQPEYMTDGIDGILCHSDDWDTFVDAINRLANDEHLRCEMGANGRAHYESEHSFDKFIDTIEHVYEEIL